MEGQRITVLQLMKGRAVADQGYNANGEVLRDVFVKHDPVDLDASFDGMTRQEFAAECDINVLLDRYEKTGVLTHYSRREPLYLDTSEYPGDLMSALDVLERSKEAFMTLPAKVRREFDQDPVKFMDFAHDPRNLEQMRAWDLAPPAPTPEAPIATPEPAPEASGK